MAEPFFGNRRGAVLALFSLVLPVILVGILGLASLSGLTTARADLQAASDAAANAVLADLNSALQLSAIPDAVIPDVDKQARASSVVQSLLGDRTDLSQITTAVATTPNMISVTVSAKIRNVTGDIFSLPFFANSATTTISWQRADQLQIAMAIDSGATAGKAAGVNNRLGVMKPILGSAIDSLSMLPNYPDIAMALVPFTAQVSTDPMRVVADTSDESRGFFGMLQQKFADAAYEAPAWLIPTAHAAVTACYNQPIAPSDADGSAFGGVRRPVPTACASPLVALRGMRKISHPYVNGTAISGEANHAETKLARDDVKSAINAIMPAGCRNLTMGVTWALAQLPTDYNPKVIFLIANGNNSQSYRGATAECAASASAKPSQAELDADFLAACALVLDPDRNLGRHIDLVVLQAVEGNSLALKSCASTTNNVSNYVAAPSVTALTTAFKQAQLNIFAAAHEQVRDQADNDNGDHQADH